jgi:hypothetical protein
VRFEFGASEYELGLTDIPMRERVLEAGVGEYRPETFGVDPDEPLLFTISLGEAQEGWHTKLVAAVISLPSA